MSAKRAEPEANLPPEVFEKFHDALEAQGIELHELLAHAAAQAAINRGQLIERIPKLQRGNVASYTAAIAAAIVGEAITPDVGRAMLYAAQLMQGNHGLAGEKTGQASQHRGKKAG